MILDLFFSVVVSFLLVAILIGLFGWRRSPENAVWVEALFLFLVLLFLVWAGGVWLEPFGPSLWGGYWLPFLLVGVIALLLLAASIPPGTRRTRHYDTSKIEPARAADEEAGKAVAVAFGVFFWFLILSLIAAIAARYAFWSPMVSATSGP